MTIATDTVFGVQKLCDEVVHHISLHESSQEDLKSMALVSRRLCISAQARLFLDVNELSYECLLPGELVLTEVTSLFHRLATVLEISPHLAHCIRYLAVLARPELLILVSAIRLSLLQNIHFNFGDTSCVDDEVVRAVQNFIRLPSIRGVHFSGLSVGIDFAHFESLFDDCSPRLDVLISLRPAFAATTTRPLIKTLKMDDASVQDDWFFSPSCPLDFTRLISFEDYPLGGLLSSAHLAIVRLKVDREVARSLDLSKFPALTYLYLTEDGRDATELIQLISTLKSNNHVQKVALNAHSAPARSKHFRDLDVFLANYTLPALREVEMHVVLQPVDRELDCAVIRALPQLEAHGLLSVTRYSLVGS
ncbi:hypothetical protein C8J57DRAFT_1665586 [Mycena rebaudengoi]|nr:hypothetical protein C8J57DRAFT_1665586 [Mycena rebaudengoi]